MRRPRVLHVTTNLNGFGGAEVMLFKLLRVMQSSAIISEVVTLMHAGEAGTAGARIRDLGVNVTELGLERGRLSVRACRTLVTEMRRFKPDIVQTWLYHPNLVGGIAAKVAGVKHVIWNIRNAHPRTEFSGRRQRLVNNACRWMAPKVPDRIIFNSHASLQEHIAAGYPPTKGVVIPNGFDLTEFRPNKGAKARLREELRLESDAFIIGMVARFDITKDHATFVQAAARFVSKEPELVQKKGVRFLLCGKGAEASNHTLTTWIEQAGLTDKFELLGQREDIPEVTAALDIATLSSITEGFPNVIGEAMACAVPVVATHVGDVGFLVGEAGVLVEPKDAEAIAAAWADIARLDDDECQRRAAIGRDRIQAHFAMPTIVEEYLALYRELFRNTYRESQASLSKESWK